MSKKTEYKRLCPTCRVKLEYRGMEDIHTGGRTLEIVEFICSIFTGLSFLAITVRDLMVKRTTFDFYVCPRCRYTIFVEDVPDKTNNHVQNNLYIEYKQKLNEVSRQIRDIKSVNYS
jgi:Zn-finger nucleic acid-binding protein